MHIRKGTHDDSPDINFIPLIDVLLVIVIFLAVSTTFTQETALEVELPQAQSQSEMPESLTVTISADGQIAVNDLVLTDSSVDTITAALAAKADPAQTVVIIRADANATHQAVVTTMQAARKAGIQKLSIAAQVGD